MKSKILDTHFFLNIALFLQAISFTSCNNTAPIVNNNIPDKVDFNLHIRPILSDRCFACHGFDNNSRKGNLRLDTKEGAFAALGELKDHHAIVPGDLSNSEAYQRIVTKDPQLKMPTINSNLKLSDEEVALIAKWIEQGAEWKKHWAFITPEKPVIPKVENSKWIKNPVDNFILARLEREQIKPSPEASKEKLLRRVTLDLTGLPPTLEELDNFLNDHSPNAYEKVVNRLLATQEYGEKMASYWLDLARYGDTHGYQNDADRTMWPWRDWVIKSFNENLPFDKFVTWQLAGDLLPNSTFDQKIATGFNRNHKISQEGALIDEEYRVEYVADRTNTFSTAFLALTMECARCHDHKFDPLTQKEYYQLFSFFNNIPENGAPGIRGVPAPTIRLIEDPDTKTKLDYLNTKIAEENQKLNQIASSETSALTQFLKGKRIDINHGKLKGLLIDLPFDELYDYKVSPNKANKKHQASTFNPQLTEGKIGKAFLFNKINILSLAHKEEINFELNDQFSLGTWVYRTLKDERDDLPIIQKTDAEMLGFTGYELGIGINQLYMRISHAWPSEGIKVKTKDLIPLNSWTHVFATYDGTGKASGVKIYINGKLATLDVYKDNLLKSIKNGNQLLIGRGIDGNDGLNGMRLDELKVYNRLLSRVEILNLMGDNDCKENLVSDFEKLNESQKKDLNEYFTLNQNPLYQTHLKNRKELLGESVKLESTLKELMVMEEMEKPRETFIHIRGSYENAGEKVMPGTPSSVGVFPKSLPQNRLGLSQWLTDPKNPLTARVAVNRFWQTYFGRGLVNTADNFGTQGSLPSHPELLDWLSNKFIESGWNVKETQKLIVMSATYRQSSKAGKELYARDPENILIARGPAYKLSAEIIRDNALAISGLLVKKVGGPSVKPYQPAGLWEEVGFGPGSATYEIGKGDDLYRRSLYTFWKRTVPNPTMIMFDASPRNVCTVKRQSTNTPLQSLALMNDPQFVEASRVLAERMIEKGGSSPELRIRFAFRSATARYPQDRELAVLVSYYKRQLKKFEKNKKAAEGIIAVGNYQYNKNITIEELAANTMVASTIFNLHETITQE